MKWLRKLSLIVVIAIVAIVVLLYKGDLPKEMVDAKYSSATSQFIVTKSGARVHYRDEGLRDGSVIVLVHGSNASLHTWEPWVAILGQHYRIVTMDLPGHGLTGQTPDDDYSSAAYLRTVDTLVNHLGISSFVLGGNSMGGGVTWRYTLAYPDKVSAMLLVDASGLPQFWNQLQTPPEINDNSAVAESEEKEVEEAKEAPLFFSLIRKPWFQTVARYIDPYWITKQGVESAYNFSPVVTNKLIDRYYELAIREGSRDATMARFSRGFSEQPNVDATQLTQPTLIIWGREDSVIPVAVAEMFAETLPRNSLIIYEDVGHAPMEEIPEKSAGDVLSFLNTLQLQTIQ